MTKIRFLYKTQLLIIQIAIAIHCSLSGMHPSKPTSLMSLPRDIHMLIINDLPVSPENYDFNIYFNSMHNACLNTRALARVNKHFYNLINNERNTSEIIYSIAKRCELNRLSVAVELRTKGAQKWIQTLASEDTSGETDKELTSFLFESVQLNNDQRLSFLLSCVPNLKDARNAKGETPLIIASREGLFNRVQTLIKAQANVNLKSSEFKTALYAATQANEHVIVTELLKAGAIVGTLELSIALQEYTEAHRLAVEAMFPTGGEDDRIAARLASLRKHPVITQSIYDGLEKKYEEQKRPLPSKKCTIQ